MKTLEQIQEENRKAIILANNPEAKSYDEALEMELDRDCKIIVWNLLGDTSLKIQDYIKSKNLASFPNMSGYFELSDNCYGKKEQKKLKLLRIIGKPLTLDRVLIALKQECICYTAEHCNLYISRLNQEPVDQIKWNLTKPTLEEQTEETQRLINNLI